MTNLGTKLTASTFLGISIAMWQYSIQQLQAQNWLWFGVSFVGGIVVTTITYVLYEKGMIETIRAKLGIGK